MRNPFRYFNSSPEVIRLVVMMYIRYPLLDGLIQAFETHRLAPSRSDIPKKSGPDRAPGLP